MTLAALDMFCGAGGFSLGMRWAGFDIVGAIDHNEPARKTYNIHHHPPAQPADLSRLLDDDGPTGDDLLNLLDLDPSDVDVVIGGPPCTGFTESSNRDPDDPINDLVWTFFDVVEAAAPRAFAMENVRGLRNHKEGETLTALCERAEDLGFTVDHKLLNSAEYEVPQKRLRLILMGIRGGEPVFPEPVDADPIPVQEPLNWISDDLLPDDEKTGHEDSTVETLSELEFGDSFHGEGRQVRLPPNEPSRTITGSNRHIHPFWDRELTIRECAVLQSFPPDYDFAGEHRENRTLQVGNAVPPKLAEHVGRALFEALGEEPKEIPTDSVGMSPSEIARMSGRLTKREVEAVLLRSGGLSWAEVGEEMGVAEKTAANLQYRAESKVREAKETIEMFERLTDEGV